MSADSTELTFVRCPSCRSLVPAVSTRCRMCGVALDPNEQDAGMKADNSKGNRVRQRTMAQKDSELSVAANRIREELSTTPEEDDVDPRSVDPRAVDPLSDYIEDSKAENKDTAHKDTKRKDYTNGDAASKAQTGAVKVAAKSEMSNTHIIDRNSPPSTASAESVATKTSAEVDRGAQAPGKVKGVVPYRRDDSKGRLFGWLVNYSNPDGISNELREGRFFVSGKNLKENDLLIDDACISTPHAFVSISMEQGLKIQDLMSERGVFMRKKSADTYQRVAEAFNVEHGDWVRFGDVEFLVCLVAHFAVK